MNATHGPRLNLGSGQTATPGWVCIDRSPNVALSRLPGIKKLLRRARLLHENHMSTWDPAIQRLDIRSLPYDERSVEAIYSSHTLEHLHLADARLVLEEAARVLRPGGILRLALPDATLIAKALAANPDSAEAGWAFNAALLSHPDRSPRGLRSLMAHSGGHIHRWQPTPAIVRIMLEAAGFERVVRCDYKSGDLPDLNAIETRPESFFLEARKPG